MLWPDFGISLYEKMVMTFPTFLDFPFTTNHKVSIWVYFMVCSKMALQQEVLTYWRHMGFRALLVQIRLLFRVEICPPFSEVIFVVVQ